MDQPTAEDALKLLERLVGDWDVESTWPDGSIGPAHGRTTFTWHDSRAHLLVTSTVDLASGADVQLYADERGVARIYRPHRRP
jgi:hypothetical protein